MPQCLIDLGLSRKVIFDCFKQVAVFGTMSIRYPIACAVHPCANRRGGTVLIVRSVVLAGANITYCTAIGDDEAGKVPLLAQCVGKHPVIGAGRNAVDLVIGAHHRAGMAFGQCSMKSRQVGILQIVGRNN